MAMTVIVILFLLLSCLPVAAQADDFEGDFWDDETSSESLEMITERMKSLSSSLNGMPEPPAFKRKINLPGDGLIENKKKSKKEGV